MAAEDLLLDRGVLSGERVVEFGGQSAVAHLRAGCAVLPWRQQHTSPCDWDRVATVAELDAAGSGSLAAIDEAVVHVQKSRAGTWADLRHAWDRLAIDGRLLVVGGNELGIKTTIKRLARELDQAGECLSQRQHARVQEFVKRTASPAPAWPASDPIEDPSLPFPLASAPGIFSADRLDAGSRLLLDCLPDWPQQPGSILDMACGNGVLGLMAGQRWSEATLHFADADARALAALAVNLPAWGCDRRATTKWWAAGEPLLVRPAPELVLLNPPWHAGKAADFTPARLMFRWLAEHMPTGGQALIVANRQLPYEAALAACGSGRLLREAEGFKILFLER